MSGAARNKRYRRRQQLGIAVIQSEVDLLSWVEFLVARGHLHRKDVEDFGAVCEATSRFLEQCLEERDASLSRYSRSG